MLECYDRLATCGNRTNTFQGYTQHAAVGRVSPHSLSPDRRARFAGRHGGSAAESPPTGPCRSYSYEVYVDDTALCSFLFAPLLVCLCLEIEMKRKCKCEIISSLHSSRHANVLLSVYRDEKKPKSAYTLGTDELADKPGPCNTEHTRLLADRPGGNPTSRARLREVVGPPMEVVAALV